MNHSGTPSLAEVVAWLEHVAPTRWAEAWDNVGLLLGDPQTPVSRVLTCLTVTPDIVEQAIALHVNLIVTHHPILFRPAQRVLAGQSTTDDVWRLARAGVAVYSPHTAFDNAPTGINQQTAQALQLEQIAPLLPTGPAPNHTARTCKIVIFCPETDREAVLTAAFAAGAGQIGAYHECSFTSQGEGTFYGTDAAHPSVGQAGRRERVPEGRVELIAPTASLGRILADIRRAHSYEEPAIDVYPLITDRWDHPGVGRVGRLPFPLPPGAFVDYLRDRLQLTNPIELVIAHNRPIQSVAIACGAGESFILEAAAAGADLLLTGEARFHRRLDACRAGVCLALIGHFASEHAGITALGQALARHFDQITVHSANEADPSTSFPPPR